ncbi:MAG: hypothetical protein EZS28_029452 [Streblomastix strix]|uniref:Uncharacterized protein n=1 Tax=Streblomastix strix TaxID=222440 RepID=A0A5J4UY43_9EUKA|nr:MAG: hypothetical protein EZS28_029452 [Streblomastix strix]
MFVLWTGSNPGMRISPLAVGSRVILYGAASIFTIVISVILCNNITYLLSLRNAYTTTTCSLQQYSESTIALPYTDSLGRGSCANLFNVSYNAQSQQINGQKNDQQYTTVISEITYGICNTASVTHTSWNLQKIPGLEQAFQTQGDNNKNQKQENIEIIIDFVSSRTNEVNGANDELPQHSCLYNTSNPQNALLSLPPNVIAPDIIAVIAFLVFPTVLVFATLACFICKFFTCCFGRCCISVENNEEDNERERAMANWQPANVALQQDEQFRRDTDRNNGEQRSYNSEYEGSYSARAQRNDPVQRQTPAQLQMRRQGWN